MQEQAFRDNGSRRESTHLHVLSHPYTHSRFFQRGLACQVKKVRQIEL